MYYDVGSCSVEGPIADRPTTCDRARLGDRPLKHARLSPMSTHYLRFHSAGHVKIIAHEPKLKEHSRDTHTYIITCTHLSYLYMYGVSASIHPFCSVTRNEISSAGHATCWRGRRAFLNSIIPSNQAYDSTQRASTWDLGPMYLKTENCDHE